MGHGYIQDELISSKSHATRCAAMRSNHRTYNRRSLKNPTRDRLTYYTRICNCSNHDRNYYPPRNLHSPGTRTVLTAVPLSPPAYLTTSRRVLQGYSCSHNLLHLQFSASYGVQSGTTVLLPSKNWTHLQLQSLIARCTRCAQWAAHYDRLGKPEFPEWASQLSTNI